MTGRTYIEGSMAQKTRIGVLLTTNRTPKVQKGHHNSVREFRTLRRVIRKSPTPKEDHSIKAPAREYKAPYGDGSFTLIKDSCVYSTPYKTSLVCMNLRTKRPCL